MTNKINKRPHNMKLPGSCTICGKPLSACNILSHVEMKINCYYISTHERIENMNGLGRNTQEYLCEDCFDVFAEHIKQIVKNKKDASS